MAFGAHNESNVLLLEMDSFSLRLSQHPEGHKRVLMLLAKSGLQQQSSHPVTQTNTVTLL